MGDTDDFVPNSEKLEALARLKDLKGDLADKDWKEMKKVADAMPNKVKKSQLRGGPVVGGGAKLAVEDESVAREREVRSTAVKWVKTEDEPAICGQLYQAMYVKKHTDAVLTKQLDSLCHGNAANRAMHELFEDLKDGETPACLKKEVGELLERTVLRKAIWGWLRQLAAKIGAAEVLEKNGLEEDNREEIRKFIYGALEKDDDRRLTTALYKQWRSSDGGKAALKRERDSEKEVVAETAKSKKTPNWTDGWKPKCTWCKEVGHWESACATKKAGKPKKT